MPSVGMAGWGASATLPAPDGYCAAVAAYGIDWALNLKSGLVSLRHAATSDP